MDEDFGKAVTTLLRDAVMEHLADCIKPDDVAEEAIMDTGDELMPWLDMQFDAEWLVSDIPPEKLAHTKEAMRIGVLKRGMASGKPSVAIAMLLPNGGGCVVGETSLALFLTAADAFKARYGDPREKEGLK